MNYDLVINLLFSSIRGKDLNKNNKNELEYIIKCGLGNFLLKDKDSGAECENLELVVGKGVCSHISLSNRISKSLIKEMEEICNYLDNNNIEYLIVKGPILSNIIYGDPIFRNFGDIDILLLDFESDALKVLTYLDKNGYVQDFGWEKKRKINTDNIVLGETINHHEINCVKGIADMYSIEIKNALSAIPKEIINDFSEVKQQYLIYNRKYPSFDFIHTFIVLCSNAFLNSESRSAIYYKSRYIRHYCDLYYWISKYAASLNVDLLIKLLNKYSLSERVKRSLGNLLSLLKYNDKIAKENSININWIEKLISQIEQNENPFNYKPVDVFVENMPSQFEVIDWGMPFSERMLGVNHSQDIIDYKNHTYRNSMIKILDSTNNLLFNGVSLEKSEDGYYIYIEKEFLNRNSYKIEILSAPYDVDVMFYGFIIESDKLKQPLVFTSNAKHYEKYIDMKIDITERNNIIICNISDIIEKSITENSIIVRVSKVEKIFDDVYRELESASYKYVIEVQP